MVLWYHMANPLSGNHHPFPQVLGNFRVTVGRFFE
jgi:hypothetical protein